jgi:hypothetical protein
MTEHTTRNTQKSFIMIPPNQDTAMHDERGSLAVHNNAVPSGFGQNRFEWSP